MILPEIIRYLLSLRYPGAETGRMNWVCYLSNLQVIIPLVPPGATVTYTVRPLHGVYAHLGYATQFNSEVVPNSFMGEITQYGAPAFTGTLTQRRRDDGFEIFQFITEQEPTYFNVTNVSPLAQRGETIFWYVVIPTPQDMVTVLDALRRLHTTTESERLLQQAAHLLGLISGQPQEPRPPIGGS